MLQQDEYEVNTEPNNTMHYTLNDCGLFTHFLPRACSDILYSQCPLITEG